MQINLSVEHEHVVLQTSQGDREMEARIKRKPDGSVDSDTILTGIRHLEQMISRALVD